MVQGFGFALTENLEDEDGKILVANLGEYKLPNIRDIPRHETLYIRDHDGPGPFQTKPIGEHGAIPTAAAIANAVYDAIGIQIRDLPITAEKVFSALRKEESLRLRPIFSPQQGRPAVNRSRHYPAQGGTHE